MAARSGGSFRAPATTQKRRATRRSRSSPGPVARAFTRDVLPRPVRSEEDRRDVPDRPVVAEAAIVVPAEIAADVHAAGHLRARRSHAEHGQVHLRLQVQHAQSAAFAPHRLPGARVVEERRHRELLHLGAERGSEPLQDVAGVLHAAGERVARAVQLHDRRAVGLLLPQFAADRADGRPPGESDDHVRVDGLGEQPSRRQRDPLEPFHLGDALRHRHDVRCHVQPIVQLLLQLAGMLDRRIDPDVDQADLARIAEQARHGRPRGGELLRDNVHRLVLQVVQPGRRQGRDDLGLALPFIHFPPPRNRSARFLHIRASCLRIRAAEGML